MKQCTKCGEVKDVEMFSQRSDRPEGRRRSRCKSCCSAAFTAWNEAHSDQRKVWSREWRSKNRDRSISMTKDWVSRNPERSADAIKRWRDNNRPRLLELAKARREKNGDAYRARERIASQKRRAMINNSDGNGVSAAQWSTLVAEFAGRCAYCNEFTDSPVMEHMMPIVRSGAHDISNVVPACQRCNSSKHTLTALEFFMSDRFNRKAG